MLLCFIGKMGVLLKRLRRNCIDELAGEIWLNIFCYLGDVEFARINTVCRLLTSEDFWRQMCETNLNFFRIEKASIVNSWRREFSRRNKYIHSFQGLAESAQIHSIEMHDTVLRLNVCILVDQIPEGGIFVDVLVNSLSDSISLSLVDFNDKSGSGSSLTFSPDTGTVIRERKSGNRIVGEYFQYLPACPLFGDKAHCSLFISRDKAISFYRNHRDQWESTGSVSNCQWVSGGQLIPCIAFRDAGLYSIQIKRVGVGLPSCVSSEDVAATPPQSIQWTSIDDFQHESSDDENGSVDEEQSEFVTDSHNMHDTQSEFWNTEEAFPRIHTP